jgi:glucan 1,3-beta-glucosidase
VDSSIANTAVGIQASTRIPGNVKGNTLISLENVDFSSTPVAVQDSDDRSILMGNTKVKSWTLGNVYYPEYPNGTFPSPGGSFKYMSRTAVPILNGPNGIIFEKSKPQYENIPVTRFTNIKRVYGAKGDGISDDTAAINKALNTEAGKSILYFPAGSYMVTNTIMVSSTFHIS